MLADYEWTKENTRGVLLADVKKNEGPASPPLPIPSTGFHEAHQQLRHHRCKLSSPF
jgi:hypothetical protein